MQLQFTKMQGLGNDFVVLNAISQVIKLNKTQIKHLADRHFGIGCDQILLVEKARSAETDFYYRIFNADGSEVEHCGNGARCFAVFVRDNHLSDKNKIVVGTAKGKMTLYFEDKERIRVNMGAPEFEPVNIPFLANKKAFSYPLILPNTEYNEIKISVVSMGNPHAVVIVDDVKTAPVEKLGKAIQAHKKFPQGVNVGFMSIKSPNEINLRVFERGCGETFACGTGACAAVVVGIQLDILLQQVKVSLLGGSLDIFWKGDNHPVWMTGIATTVYTGMIRI